jgi:cardiolipin synthase A/B
VEAVRRGVRVVILVPGVIDYSLVRHASRRHFGRLLEAGVEIHEYQDALLHAKTMVIDDVWATIGTTNLDNRSFALNDEVNLIVYDTDVARRLESVFVRDLAHARRIDYPRWSARGLLDRLWELLAIPLQDTM